MCYSLKKYRPTLCDTKLLPILWLKTSQNSLKSTSKAKKNLEGESPQTPLAKRFRLRWKLSAACVVGLHMSNPPPPPPHANIFLRLCSTPSVLLQGTSCLTSPSDQGRQKRSGSVKMALVSLISVKFSRGEYHSRTTSITAGPLLLCFRRVWRGHPKTLKRSSQFVRYVSPQDAEFFLPNVELERPQTQRYANNILMKMS